MEVKVTIEKSSDGTYAAFMEEDLADFGLAGYGATAKEAMDDFFESVKETKEYLIKEGKEMPELIFKFQYDLQSFFSYFSYLNISKVGEKSGIGASLMRQYASGAAKAGPKQYEKIRRAVQTMAEELRMASI